MILRARILAELALDAVGHQSRLRDSGLRFDAAALSLALDIYATASQLEPSAEVEVSASDYAAIYCRDVVA